MRSSGDDLELRTGPTQDEFDAALTTIRRRPAAPDLYRLPPGPGHEARVALTLPLLGGLTTDEIAPRVPDLQATVAQRIVRAKRTLAAANVPFEVPHAAEPPARLASVLEVIYLIFNEGYAATAGDDWMRPALCEEALRLGRILAELMPKEPEVHGLVALMEIQASRLRARVRRTASRSCSWNRTASRWDHLLIRRGLAALARASNSAAHGPVCAAGGHRRLSRPGAHAGRDGLGPHRRAVRCAGRSSRRRRWSS